MNTLHKGDDDDDDNIYETRQLSNKTVRFMCCSRKSLLCVHNKQRYYKTSPLLITRKHLRYFRPFLFPFYSPAQNSEKRLLASSYLSVCLSVRMEQFAPTRRILTKFDIGTFVEKSVEKLNFL